VRLASPQSGNHPSGVTRFAGVARARSSPEVTETVQDWAREFLETQSLDKKCRPGTPPDLWERAPEPLAVRANRPSELTVTLDQPAPFTLTTLKGTDARCLLMHKFWHHELQAAELMAWGILRFVETPHEFREGLLGILLDEVRHMGLYEAYLQARGHSVGDFPVRDFLWERVELCTSPIAFVALLGMGMEAANLEHAARFEARLRAAGDEEGALIQRQIGLEEVAHVRFATRWFRTWTGGLDFARYRAELPADLKAQAVRGKHLQLEARRRAGMTDEFLQKLAAWDHSS
jgi:uncharacterized ferritin-like protein (DUF455 family)